MADSVFQSPECPCSCARRRLTPRSSGAPTAGHQARAGCTRYILTSPGLASYRWLPLSSNVMPQKGNPKTPPLTDIRKRQFMVFVGTWSRSAVGLVAFGRVVAVSRLVSRVMPVLGCESIMLVGPAAQAACWPMAGGVARRSEAVARRRAGLKDGSQSSSLGRPPWCGLAGLGRCQGGRQGSVAGRSAALRGLGLSRVLGELHLAPRCWLMHNTSLKRSAIGRPPAPGLLHTVHFHRPGPVGLPLSSA